MPLNPIEGFADNWAYLKTEFNWLDRVLMTAVARQRKEAKEIDRLSHSRADRATSHWWKGVISLEGNAAYDEHRQPLNDNETITKQTYQQQLDAKIRASQKHGIVLGLPLLHARLGLTLFEKNLVLMSLAPEVNRRYARLYRYLQGDDPPAKTDLPTVDLVLRLLCRNDVDWRSARSRLVTSPLVQNSLLKVLPYGSDTFLNQPLKLTDALIDYLLADQPTTQALDQILQPFTPALPPPRLLSTRTPMVDWSALVLPPPLLESLQALSQRSQQQEQVDHQWGFAQQRHHCPGTIALLIGEAGTGKTMAVEAIATSLNVPLVSIDLASVGIKDYPQLLHEITTQSPAILLLKSAQIWLGRTAVVASADVHQVLAARRDVAGLTIFSVRSPTMVRWQWQQQIDYCLPFPMPDKASRLQLWQKAFPLQVPLSSAINWQTLAQHGQLSGSDIAAIARNAAIGAAAANAAQVEMSHIVQALKQYRKGCTVSIAATKTPTQTEPPRRSTKRKQGS